MTEDKNLNMDDELEEDGPFYLTLTDENGKDADFEFLDEIEYEGKNYVVLVPADENAPDADQAVILEVVPGEGDEDFYKGVGSEKIVNAVFEIFKEHNADEFNFVD